MDNHAYAIDATRHAPLAPYSDELYDRHLGRRGDAVLAVRAADPLDADAVANTVVAACRAPPRTSAAATRRRGRRPAPATTTACSGARRASRVGVVGADARRRLAASARFAELINVLLCHFPRPPAAR